MIRSFKKQDGKLQYRCKKCKKMLGKSNQTGFEIMCLRCGTINTIFEKMKDQVIITNSSGKILFANSEIERITGYKLKEVIGKTPALWGGQMSKDFYRELWRIILQEKKSVMASLTNRHKSGRLYNVKLRISPVVGTDNKVKSFVGIETVLKGNLSEKEKWPYPQI